MQRKALAIWPSGNCRDRSQSVSALCKRLCRALKGQSSEMNALEENSNIAAAAASLEDLVPILAAAGATPLERLQALRANVPGRIVFTAPLNPSTTLRAALSGYGLEQIETL